MGGNQGPLICGSENIECGGRRGEITNSVSLKRAMVYRWFRGDVQGCKQDGGECSFISVM